MEAVECAITGIKRRINGTEYEALFDLYEKEIAEFGENFIKCGELDAPLDILK